MGLLVHLSNSMVSSKVHTHPQWFQRVSLAPLFLKKRQEIVGLISGRAPLLVKYSANHSKQLILIGSSCGLLALQHTTINEDLHGSSHWILMKNTYELRTIIPNLQMQKLRLIEVGEFAHSHAVGQWGSQLSIPDLSCQHPSSEFSHYAACPDVVFS